METIGYKPSVSYISCDPEEAYRRHIEAVKEDPNYISAYFTQEAVLEYFL